MTSSKVMRLQFGLHRHILIGQPGTTQKLGVKLLRSHSFAVCASTARYRRAVG